MQVIAGLFADFLVFFFWNRSSLFCRIFAFHFGTVNYGLFRFFIGRGKIGCKNIGQLVGMISSPGETIVHSNNGNIFI